MFERDGAKLVLLGVAGSVGAVLRESFERVP